MLAVVYGRTSKETDDTYSVGSQISNGNLYAERNSLTVPPDYVFREDFTGRLLDRPAYGKIRELVRARKIQAVIVAATDRLARKVSVGEILLDELLAYGVQLHIIAWNTFVRDTPEDRLRFNFEATFSGFEREKIVVRTRDGKIRKAQMEQVIGNTRPQYGYQFNPQKTNFLPSPQADIARRVLIAYGMEQTKPNVIASQLEAEGHPTPGALYYQDRMRVAQEKLEVGRLTPEQFAAKQQSMARYKGQNRWTAVNVYNILIQHEVYAGNYRFTFAGQEFVVPIPPVITQEEADAVAHMLKVGKRRFARKAATRYEHLMARRLTCATCSHSFISNHNRNGNLYYRCSLQRPRSTTTCTNKPVTEKEIARLTRLFIKDLLLSPARLFAWWQAQFAEQEENNQTIDTDMTAIERRIELTTEKFNRTLSRLTDNLDEDELSFYTRQRDDLKTLLQEYRVEREGLTSKRVEISVSPEVIGHFTQMGKRYRETLETSEDFTFWRGMVDDLDITGTIGTEEDGRRYIEFVVFGKARKREYLAVKANGDEGFTQNLIDFDRS